MNNITILDGGFSTQLAHHVGDIIDGDPLWSARFLKINPKAVRQSHLDFLRAGAEIIITNSYQASIPGFMEYLGCDMITSFNLIKESVKLAVQARESYLEENPGANRPLIAGSVGPYGASLHDGSEYTGSYIDNTDRETIETWHRPRIEALIEEGVDLLALETIPTLEEAIILLELIKEYPKQKAWLCFQCKDSQHTARGENFQEAAKKCWTTNREQLIAVGCNCLNPNYVTELIEGLNNGSAEHIPLIVYPNSGEEYSPEKGWTGNKNCLNVTKFIHEWLDLGVRFVGGCCRMDASDIVKIRDVVQLYISEHKNRI